MRPTVDMQQTPRPGSQSESSCCGEGSWEYARVEGYVLAEPHSLEAAARVETGTIDDSGQKTEIRRLFLEKHLRAG